MVPLIATKTELDILKGVIDRVAGEVEQDKGKRLEYIVGTMIELPRAALRAERSRRQRRSSASAPTT